MPDFGNERDVKPVKEDFPPGGAQSERDSLRGADGRPNTSSSWRAGALPLRTGTCSLRLVSGSSSPRKRHVKHFELQLDALEQECGAVYTACKTAMRKLETLFDDRSRRPLEWFADEREEREESSGEEERESRTWPLSSPGGTHRAAVADAEQLMRATPGRSSPSAGSSW